MCSLRRRSRLPANVVAMMWGAEDLVASLGGTASRFRDGHFRAIALHARSSVLIAAGANGKAAIDTVHLAIDDTAGLAAEARDAVASGFVATACIHPSQVEVIREAYAPTPDEVAYAAAIIEQAEHERGVFTLRGPDDRRAACSGTRGACCSAGS